MQNVIRFILSVLFIGPSILSVGQSFELSPENLLPLYAGKIQWADLDNDHDLDLIYSGLQFEVTDGFATQVYENNNGSFILRTTELPHLRNGTIALGDYDKDGDLDVLLSGLKDSANDAITHLYKNTGAFSFTLTQTFPGLINSTTSWIDIDNDEDLDFLVSGTFNFIDGEGNGIEELKLLIFENIDGNFVVLENPGIKSFSASAMDWADRNEDGKIDLAVTGLGSDFMPTTEIYLNNGDKTFRKDESENFADLFSGEIKWGDFDNDADMDVLLTGFSYEMVPATILYENNGSTWKKRDDVNLTQLGGNYFGGVKWLDFNNDGYLDILMAGSNTASQYFFKLYKNNGEKNFIEEVELDGIAEASVDFGDYDNDGDVDLCYMGTTPTGSGTGIYKNKLLNEIHPNSRPISPNINSFSETKQFRKELMLSWGNGSDTQTPALGLSYNFYVRNEAQTIVTSPSNFTTGSVLTHSSPNGQSKRAILRGIPEGTIHWAVQSIDGSKWGSFFSTEKTFYQINGPETLKAEIINIENIKLSWIDNSTIETSYQIMRSTDLLNGFSSVATLQANTDSYIDHTAFLTDTYYYYRVYAENAYKASGYDSLRVLIPTPPTNLLAKSVNASTITLTWDDLSAYESGYQIARKLTSGFNFEIVATLEAGAEVFTDIDLSEGTSYDYIVYALNEYGTVSGAQSSAQTNFKPLGENFELETLEDEVMLFNEQEFINAFSDPDVGDELVEIVITSLPQKGTLKLNGNIITVGQIISLADLKNLTFIPNQNENGITAFSFYNNDGKDNSSSSYTVTLTITPVNDAPTGENFGLETLEDELMLFNGQEFINAFSDPDLGDELVEIVITSLPLKGTLKLSGNIVTTGQIIPLADLKNLTFVPNQNENGITSFSFYNNDGKENSSSSYTATLTLIPVNDAPTLTIIADIEIEEGTEIPLITFSVEDVDDPIASIAMSAISNNQNLIQDSKIIIQGTTHEKTIHLLPEEGSAGEALITLSASDETLTTSIQFRFTVIPVTSLPEIESQRIKIYPNPFASLLTISLKETAQPKCLFVIRDLMGRVVVSQYIKEQESTFDLEWMNSGMYTISITETNSGFIFDYTLIKH